MGLASKVKAAPYQPLYPQEPVPSQSFEASAPPYEPSAPPCDAELPTYDQGQQPFVPQFVPEPGYRPGQTAPVYITSLVESRIRVCVARNCLQGFYPEERLRDVIATACSVNWYTLSSKWSISIDLICDLAQLALYDVVMFVDDSGTYVHCSYDDREHVIPREWHKDTRPSGDHVTHR